MTHEDMRLLENLKKLTEKYELFMYSKSAKVSSFDIGELNVLIREVTIMLLEWQNISRETAEALVEAAYQAGR